MDLTKKSIDDDDVSSSGEVNEQDKAELKRGCSRTEPFDETEMKKRKSRSLEKIPISRSTSTDSVAAAAAKSKHAAQDTNVSSDEDDASEFLESRSFVDLKVNQRYIIAEAYCKDVVYENGNTISKLMLTLSRLSDDVDGSYESDSTSEDEMEKKKDNEKEVDIDICTEEMAVDKETMNQQIEAAEKLSSQSPEQEEEEEEETLQKKKQEPTKFIPNAKNATGKDLKKNIVKAEKESLPKNFKIFLSTTYTKPTMFMALNELLKDRLRRLVYIALKEVKTTESHSNGIFEIPIYEFSTQGNFGTKHLQVLNDPFLFADYVNAKQLTIDEK
jgi:hypothetical protein